MVEIRGSLHSPEAERINLIAYQNYYQAVQFVDTEAGRASTCITEKLFQDLHRTCLRNIFFENEIGRYRQESVSIVGASVTPPHFSRVPELMRDYVADFQERLQGCQTFPQIRGVSEAVDLLAWGHYVFIRIHPFSDGNGRVIRLGCDFLCRKFKLKPIIWPSNRNAYIDALEAVNKSGNLDHLGLLMARSLMERYKEGVKEGLLTGEIRGTLAEIIETKSTSIINQTSFLNFENIWPGFNRPCFT